MTRWSRTVLAVLAAGAVYAAGPIRSDAAEACKTLKTKEACAQRDDCTFVAEYQKAGGKKVAAYCRAKGGAGQAKATKKKAS